MFYFFAGLIISYLVGSIPTSYIVGMKLRGIDLRKCGSGNLGATNAFRVLGWKIGVIVLLIDMIKGILPVLLLPGPIAKAGVSFLAAHNIALLMGLAAIIGHIFSIFMQFKGGKGVATSMGVFLALAPAPFAITLVFCLILIFVTRIVSLASLIGAIMLPVLVYVFYPERLSLILFVSLIGLIIIVRHRANIKRLLQGKENKIFP
jgi:acyl phosphate:glycerol-3-phosphate acyltransferase